MGCRQEHARWLTTGLPITGRWENGELHYMAEISPASSRPSSPQPRPTLNSAAEAEPPTPSLAKEAAKAARAAAERAARLTDEHWSTSGPTQASILLS